MGTLSNNSALPPAFAALEPALRRLRIAVKSALDTRPKAKSGARACAREFGFDKSIGWKIYQIGYADDSVTVLGAIPGARGWEIVFSKLQMQRVPDAIVGEVKASLLALENELSSRRIDRSMLAGMAAASGDGTDGARQMLRIRKQATDAMAVIFGVHANARVGGYLCMLGASTGMVEIEAITMIEGLERRRPGVAWVAHEPMQAGTGAAATGDGSVLIPGFSSHGLKPTEIAPSSKKPGVFEFIERAPDRKDALVACFVESAKGVRPASGMSIPIVMPTAVCVFDVFLHDSVDKPRDLRVEVLAGVPDGSSSGGRPVAIDAHVSQPSSLHVEDLSPQANASYALACGNGASKRGKDLTQFSCYRVTVPHPPIPCTVRISWEA